MLRQTLRAKLDFHRFANAPLHFLGFAAQHRGLVRHAHDLQMHVRIEARRVSAFELLQKFLLVSAVDDVVTNVIGLGQCEYNQIMRVGRRGLRTGCLGLFVPGLAVNNTRALIAGIFANAPPHTHHVAARRVHDDAAHGLDAFARGDLGPEGGDDHDVLALELCQLRFGRFARNGLNSHVTNLIIHLGIMDNLPEQIDGFFLGKIAARRVSQVDRAFDAIAEAEFLGELDGQSGSGK